MREKGERRKVRSFGCSTNIHRSLRFTSRSLSRLLLLFIFPLHLSFEHTPPLTQPRIRRRTRAHTRQDPRATHGTFSVSGVLSVFVDAVRSITPSSTKCTKRTKGRMCLTPMIICLCCLTPPRMTRLTLERSTPIPPAFRCSRLPHCFVLHSRAHTHAPQNILVVAKGSPVRARKRETRRLFR